MKVKLTELAGGWGVKGGIKKKLSLGSSKWTVPFTEIRDGPGKVWVVENGGEMSSWPSLEMTPNHDVVLI